MGSKVHKTQHSQNSVRHVELLLHWIGAQGFYRMAESNPLCPRKYYCYSFFFPLFSYSAQNPYASQQGALSLVSHY